MHAHDRTYLASLGFADPDKKDRRHGLACQYLASWAISGKLVEMFGGKKSYTFMDGDGYIELVHSKGEGKYRTTLGFLDMVYPFSRDIGFEGRKRRPADPSDPTCALVCEVKIGRVDIGDVIRQINLYREHKVIIPDLVCKDDNGSCSSAEWVLATPYPISPVDKASLKTAGIHHVRLGPAFDAWCAEQEVARDDPAADVTI